MLRTGDNVSDTQRPIFMPLKVMAVPLDLILDLSPHSGFIITGSYILAVGINKTGPRGRRDRLDAVPVDVLDASLPELVDELGGLCLQGSGQAQPRRYWSLAAFMARSAWYLRCPILRPT